jgi:hypothetical protein
MNLKNRFCVSRSECTDCADSQVFKWNLLLYNPEWTLIKKCFEYPNPYMEGESFRQVYCFDGPSSGFWALWAKYKKDHTFIGFEWDKGQRILPHLWKNQLSTY